MSSWDILLPHRYFINRALRKASNELRDHIDSYRIEYEMEVQRCRDEIETARAEKDRQFEMWKEACLNELAQDSALLGKLQMLLPDYADLHIKKNILYMSREKMKRELELLNEYGDFLTAQMNLIGEDITILEQRQKSLMCQIKVDDIVELMSLTGANLSGDGCDNPKILLEKVNSILYGSSNLLPPRKAALFRLKELLQERAEYLPMIEYISWLIRQKKGLSRDLSRERRKVNESKKILRNQIAVAKTEINQLTEIMRSKAICIRNVWAEPLAEIYIQLAEITEYLEQSYDYQEEINDEIQTMISVRSHDSERWEVLLIKRKCIYDIVGRLKDEKTKLYLRRKQWLDRRTTVLNLCKKNNVFLLQPKGKHVSDEIRVLEEKRVELGEKIEDVSEYQEDIMSIDRAIAFIQKKKR